MTPTEKEILQIIKNKGCITLAGNKEYYTILDYIRGQFVIHGGDTVTNQEEYRHLITEEQALDHICSYYKDQAGIFSKSPVSSREEILEYMKKWHNL